MRRGRRARLALGANTGEPRRTLRWALRELGRLPGTRLLAASRAVRTAPIGPPQPDFFNCCATVFTRLSPMGLLTELKRLEALAGRKPGKRWGPRPLDIDIVAYGRGRIRTPWLTVPHPEAARRDFVRTGLRELSSFGRPSP